jgi:methylamine dehydrogenase light chain
MTDYDSMVERWSRRLAKTAGRRSILKSLGTLLVGAAAMPLLPVSRARAASLKEEGDPATCEYWRYCAIDGFLCACCGGSVTVCPPGTEPAPITWVGTCRNAADGRNYVVSYNDCCGKSACGRCLCNRNEGDGPLYRPPVSNDYNWCIGSNSNIPYHCTVSRIIQEVGQ